MPSYVLREAVLALIEMKRREVLENPNDPSWTEHFAQLYRDVQNFVGFSESNKSPEEVLPNENTITK